MARIKNIQYLPRSVIPYEFLTEADLAPGAMTNLFSQFYNHLLSHITNIPDCIVELNKKRIRIDIYIYFFF